MLDIILKSQEATEDTMIELESLGLIKRMMPPSDLSPPPGGKSYVKRIYETDILYGGHMLLFVSLNHYSARLNYHPDKEDILLINSGGIVKPVIWVFGKSSYKETKEKIETGALSSQDFIALNIPFNNPRISFFSISKGTPHFEVTIPGTQPNPSFWVTEPSNLSIVPINLNNYQIKIES